MSLIKPITFGKLALCLTIVCLAFTSIAKPTLHSDALDFKDKSSPTKIKTAVQISNKSVNRPSESDLISANNPSIISCDSNNAKIKPVKSGRARSKKEKFSSLLVTPGNQWTYVQFEGHHDDIGKLEQYTYTITDAKVFGRYTVAIVKLSDQHQRSILSYYRILKGNRVCESSQLSDYLTWGKNAQTPIKSWRDMSSKWIRHEYNQGSCWEVPKSRHLNEVSCVVLVHKFRAQCLQLVNQGCPLVYTLRNLHISRST